MTNLENVYKKLAKSALSYTLDGLQHVEILHKWFSDGDEEGPSILYLNKNREDLGNRMTSAQHDEFSTIFHKFSPIIRGSSDLENSKQANIFHQIIQLNGGYTVVLSYDPGLDEWCESEMRGSISDELYEQYEREQRNKATECSVEDDQKPDGAEGEGDQMTFQELMSFLYEEVTCDVPDGWVRVDIASVVGIVDGHNETHVVYSYMLESEAQSHRFTTKNIFGPMNAIIEIERLMAAEGNGWEKGLFTFHPDGRLSLETDEKIIQGRGLHLF